MIKRLSGVGAFACFGVCLAAPVLFFLGRIGEGRYKLAFNLASLGWFVFATAWMAGRRGRSDA
jgi:hypothetical protein